MKDTNIEKLKEENGEVYEIRVPEDDEGKKYAVGYLKKPDRKVLAAVMSRIGHDPLGAHEMLLRNCWLEGDRRIMEEDELFLGACAAMEELIRVRQGLLKKI